MIIPLFLCSCALSSRESEHVKLSHKLSNSYIKELASKKGLAYLGGGGAFIDHVNEISLTFQSDKKLTLNEARKFIIELDEELISKYNNCQEIRPYLKNYPFTPYNTTILILFDSPTNSLEEPTLKAVKSTSNASVFYTFEGSQKALSKLSQQGLVNLPGSYDPFPRKTKLESNSRISLLKNEEAGIYYETYEEAYRLVYGRKRPEF